MIETYGLTHLNLEVADPEASLRFYQQMFGVKEYFRDENSIQVQGPGEKDVLAFVRSDNAGVVGGISHFGFRLMASCKRKLVTVTDFELFALVRSTQRYLKQPALAELPGRRHPLAGRDPEP